MRPAVAAICVRLDGLPLAVELAAARCRVMSPQALLPRLDDALTILTSGDRDLPARHRTLRATIAWSYDSLEAPDQRLLDALSVFPGTFTLDSAESVCSPDPSPDLAFGFLDGVAALVERSLLTLHPSTTDQPEDRYSLLVSIRDFAVEQLARRDRHRLLTLRHAEHFVQRTILPAEWTLPDRARRTAMLAAELHNLRAALDFAQRDPDPDRELQLAPVLASFLTDRGMIGQARSVNDHGLSRTGPGQVSHVVLLRNRVRIEFNSEQLTEASRWATKLLDAARELGEMSLLADALAVAAINARTRLEVHRLIAEAEALMRVLPSHGGQLPRWFVDWTWSSTLFQCLYTVPDRAEAAQRARVARPLVGDDVDDERQRLGSLLLRRGRLAEAEEFLAPFEVPGTVHRQPWVGVSGAVDAAVLRMARQDFTAAGAALDLATRRLAGLDNPGLAAWTAFEQAILDRATGDSTAAAVGLEAILAAPPGDVDPLQRAQARWLLAVLARDRGDSAAAAEHLDQAWSTAAGCDAQYLDLILMCLLERAAQLASREPAEAARLLGLVTTHRGGLTLEPGVAYDTEALLAVLRERLGAGELTRILDSVGGPATTRLTDLGNGRQPQACSRVTGRGGGRGIRIHGESPHSGFQDWWVLRP